MIHAEFRGALNPPALVEQKNSCRFVAPVDTDNHFNAGGTIARHRRYSGAGALARYDATGGCNRRWCHFKRRVSNVFLLTHGNHSAGRATLGGGRPARGDARAVPVAGHRGRPGPRAHCLATAAWVRWVFFGRRIAGCERARCSVLVHSPALAAVLGLGLIVLRRPIGFVGFSLVGALPDVTALGEAYFSIRIYEAPFYLMTLAMTALMRGQGDALVPMYIVIGVNVVNIVGDLLLVPGTFGLPSYGVTGAAWASLAAQGAGWIAAMIIGWRRVQAYWDWDWIRRWRELAWQRFFSVQAHLFIRTLALVLTLAAVT